MKRLSQACCLVAALSLLTAPSWRAQSFSRRRRLPRRPRLAFWDSGVD
jgi:hypothetical protein